jgi:hypothetical protein
MIAGFGMLTFVTRDGLGSGPNLSCTVLYLGLVQMVASGRQIGSAFNILLDNTTGDNKHNEMIFMLAWLVLTDKMDEASFFCMMKGHTYSQIDQSFRTLIGQLLQVHLHSPALQAPPPPRPTAAAATVGANLDGFAPRRADCSIPTRL